MVLCLRRRTFGGALAEGVTYRRIGVAPELVIWSAGGQLGVGDDDGA